MDHETSKSLPRHTVIHARVAPGAESTCESAVATLTRAVLWSMRLRDPDCAFDHLVTSMNLGRSRLRAQHEGDEVAPRMCLHFCAENLNCIESCKWLFPWA